MLRFGANSPDVIERLRWLGTEFFTTMQVAVRGLADANLKPLMAQALHMGDELHNRNAAASGLLFKRLTLALLASKLDSGVIQRALAFVAGNDHFFLNISMAACKSMSDAAHGVPGSSMVTVMARNGVNFGIRLSGTGDQWFQAPANPVDGLYFPGYTVEDAAADLGDSAITETNGLGGFAMAASPAIVQFVGGTPADATANSRRMLSITLGSNPAFTLPPLNFGGTPAGIDARLVADSGVLPIINTGIAHRKAGVGQIGAGITTAPMECFNDAIAALATGLEAIPIRKEGSSVSKTAVVAFGGNALVTDAEHDSIPEQYETVCRTVSHLVDLIEQGWRLVVSHGNGPQVGFILRRSELSEAEVDPVPVDYAVADTQGAIGYMFVKALTNELTRRGLARPVVAIVTQSVVDPADEAFKNPTKPIGSFLNEATARARQKALGWTIMEDAGRGWRRTVPSPRPQRILESETIRMLLDSGAVVVAAGGGGIPVAVQPDGTVVGVEAVVDKDLASGLLAHELARGHAAHPHRRRARGHPLRQAGSEVAGHAHRRGGPRLYRGRRIRRRQHGAEGRRRGRLRREHARRGRRHRVAGGDARHHRRPFRHPHRQRGCGRARPVAAAKPRRRLGGPARRQRHPHARSQAQSEHDGGRGHLRARDDHRARLSALDHQRRSSGDDPGHRRFRRRGPARSVVRPRRGPGRNPPQRAARPGHRQGAAGGRIDRVGCAWRERPRRRPARDHRARRMAQLHQIQTRRHDIMKLAGIPILPEVEPSQMPFWRQVLRGFSQCAFQANELTALFFIAAATLFNWRMGAAYVVSVIIATIVARLLAGIPDLLGLGLYGFNSGLMGLALANFFQPGPALWCWVPVLAAVVAAVTVAMARWLPFPFLAAPFIGMFWALWPLAETHGPGEDRLSGRSPMRR